MLLPQHHYRPDTPTAELAVGWAGARHAAQESSRGRLLDPENNLYSQRKEAMFYVVLIVIAVLLAGALYFMRGRQSASR